MKKRFASSLALAWLVANAVFISLTARRRGGARRIPNEPFCRVTENQKLIRYHPASFSKALAHVRVPQHPFMAPNPCNNMHCDAYISDTYEASGPLALNCEILTRTEGFGGYGTITADSRGRLVAVYSNGRAFRIEVLDHRTLEKIASYSLPPRPLSQILGGVRPWEYLGAGMYFYLDNEDRAVVPTTRNTLQVVQTPAPGEGNFRLVREYDLSGYLVPGKEDSAAFVLPEWSGDYYWYATVEGMVGTINVKSGEIRNLRLEGELVENSFAVGEDGVFIISDQAMYRFSRDGTGNPVVDWRTGYHKAADRKAGHISVGSGTSVTLVGTPEDGLVVIADNDHPRINVLFIKRSDGTLVASQPVFADGKSGTDLTAIAFEHGDENGNGLGFYSVVIENNWGNHTFPISRPEPGLARVDAWKNGDGTYSCKEVWSNKEPSIGGFRLSFGNGLVYIYGKEGSWLKTRWYLIGVDFATGETVYKRLTGTGMGYNNWSGCLFLHPEGGIAYSTTIFGAVMIRDTTP